MPLTPAPSDANLQLADVTTGNVSTSKHGFAPKAPNDGTKYLDGTGVYSVPTGTAAGVKIAHSDTAAPTATDDGFGHSSTGITFAIGNLWLQTISTSTAASKNVIWELVDATSNAAVWNRLANANDSVALGAAILPGVLFINSQIASVASGHNSGYTCPTGRRAAVMGMWFTNSAGTSTTSFPEFLTNSAYFQLAASNSAATGTTNVFTFPLALILEAGESVSLNASQSGGKGGFGIIEIDSTASIKSVIRGTTTIIRGVAALTANDNTLYTCPTGKSAAFTGNSAPAFSNNGLIACVNLSGGSRTYKVNNVVSGGSPGTSNQITSQTVSTNTASTVTILSSAANCFSPGDFLNINLDANTSSQLVWGNVVEK